VKEEKRDRKRKKERASCVGGEDRHKTGGGEG
jgi:hypothetical protein